VSCKTAPPGPASYDACLTSLCGPTASMTFLTLAHVVRIDVPPTSLPGFIKRFVRFF
jgi:hypothetical protein